MRYKLRCLGIKVEKSAAPLCKRISSHGLSVSEGFKLDIYIIIIIRVVTPTDYEPLLTRVCPYRIVLRVIASTIVDAKQFSFENYLYRLKLKELRYRLKPILDRN
jgi:hypothetical protein